MASSIDSTVQAPFKAAPLPEVINHTPWPSQNFQHIDPQGDIYHVVVTRVSYSLRGMNYEGDQLPCPTALPPEQQGELVSADEYQAQVNASSVIEESDFAPYKPLCDVLLSNAIAHAPEGKPAKRWFAGFKFGAHLVKKFQVTGPRHYESGLVGWRLSEPEAALSVPLCYELAYGGPNLVPAHDSARTEQEDAQLPAYYEPNPIGTGRLGGRDTKAWLEQQCAQFKQLSKIQESGKRQGQAEQTEQAEQLQQMAFALNAQGHYRAPQIEDSEQAFDGQADYPCVGVGPVARWWLPRRKYAGTHDEHWKETQWPKSPLDHDYRYWNCAPEDQQVPYPQGGEEIALANLTPSTPNTASTALSNSASFVRFALPSEQLQVLVRLHSGPMLMMPMNIDTVVIDFAQARLSVVSRVLIPAELEVRKLHIGTADPDDELMRVPGASLASSVHDA